MVVNELTEGRTGFLRKIGFRVILAEHAVCKLKLQEKTLGFSQRFTFVPTAGIDRDNRTPFATDFDKVFWGIMSADLFIRNSAVAQNRRGLALTGTSDVAMGAGLRGNVREIKEELDELNAIHVEMIKLSGFAACFAMEWATPPHCKEIEDRRTSKEGLSYTVQTRIH